MTNWKAKDNELRHLLNKCGEYDSETDIVKEFKQSVLPYLKNNMPWRQMLNSFFEECDKANTVYTCNLCLDQLYDYADVNKIWIGL
jgi:hypothetical protein